MPDQQCEGETGSNSSVAEEWLAAEDASCRRDRLERLKWLSHETPNAEYWTFSGGLMSKYLFEEARYCFVYGQFLATILLGLSYIEHTLAGLFFGSGRDDLERASISTLLQEALACGWIDEQEFEHLEKARTARNPVAHFRRPLAEATIERRMVAQDELPYYLIEEDACHVMKVALHLLGRDLF